MKITMEQPNDPQDGRKTKKNSRLKNNQSISNTDPKTV